MNSESNAETRNLNPVRYFMTLDGKPCANRIGSMLTVLFACVLSLGTIAGKLPINVVWYVLALLIYGFRAEIAIVVERARQPPSSGGPPGLTTDHEGHPSTLRVKHLLCFCTGCVLALTSTFGNRGEPTGLIFCLLFLPIVSSGLLGLIERRIPHRSGQPKTQAVPNDSHSIDGPVGRRPETPAR